MKDKKEEEDTGEKSLDSKFKESIDELFEQEQEQEQEQEEQEQVDFLGEVFFIQEDGFLGSSNDDFIETIVEVIEKNKNSERLFVELKSLLEERIIHYKDLQAIAVRLANLGLWEEASLFLDGFGYFPIYGHKDFVSINEETDANWFVYAKYKLILSIIEEIENDGMKYNILHYLANVNRFNKVSDFIQSISTKVWVEKIHRRFFGGVDTMLQYLTHLKGFETVTDYIESVSGKAYDEKNNFLFPIDELAPVINCVQFDGINCVQFNGWEKEEFSKIYNFFIAQKERESSLIEVKGMILSIQQEDDNCEDE